jgi:tRNA(Ile)-lysidine synthase
MLASLARLREGGARPFALRCVHVEHGLRPAEESLGDAEAVKALCKRLGVPCRVAHIPPGRVAEAAGNGGPGIEAAARLFRRRVLLREARRAGAAKVLTAHTRDDLLETILLRVLRGAGPAGLAPMPRERGRLLRPLLGLGRSDALRYLVRLGVPWRTDSTNGSLRFLRNRVRLKLVPALDEFFPQWKSALLGMAETQGLAAAFLAGEAGRRLSWEEAAPGRLSLPWNGFFAESAILREEALFRGIDRLVKGGRVPSRRALRRFTAGTRAADLGPARVFREGGKLVMERKAHAPRGAPRGGASEEGFTLLLKEPGSCMLCEAGLRLRIEAVPAAEAGEPTDAASFRAALPVALRKAAAGDRFPEGRHGGALSGIIGQCRLRLRAEDAGGTAAFVFAGDDGSVAVEAARGAEGKARERADGAVVIRVTGGFDD